MLVHAIDEGAVAFYRKFEFEPSPLDPKQLMLLMEDLRVTLQSVGLGKPGPQQDLTNQLRPGS
jgi:hypothetical protein